MQRGIDLSDHRWHAIVMWDISRDVWDVHLRRLRPDGRVEAMTTTDRGQLIQHVVERGAVLNEVPPFLSGAPPEILQAIAEAVRLDFGIGASEQTLQAAVDGATAEAAYAKGLNQSLLGILERKLMEPR